MIADAKVTQRLAGFVEKLQEETVLYYSKTFTMLTPPTIEVKEGSKFYKIVKSETGSRSVHCFVSKVNGDIYKAASWKTPAKHIRGNIFDANYSYGTGVTLYGGAYIR